MQALRVKPPKPNGPQAAANGSPAAPRRMIATGQMSLRSVAIPDVQNAGAGEYVSPSCEPDRDELPDDQEIPF